MLGRLAAAIKEVMALPALQERCRQASSSSGPLWLDDTQRFVRAEADAWRPLAVASGATVH